ncbi:MAG TPA: hypothetical protein VII81_07430, partial [Terriglobales bacterium]
LETAERKSLWTDQLRSFGEIKKVGAQYPMQQLSRLPNRERSPWAVSNFGRLNTGQNCSKQGKNNSLQGLVARVGFEPRLKGSSRDVWDMDSNRP